jgi:hypothetical protein
VAGMTMEFWGKHYDGKQQRISPTPNQV